MPFTSVNSAYKEVVKESKVSQNLEDHKPIFKVIKKTAFYDDKIGQRFEL